MTEKEKNNLHGVNKSCAWVAPYKTLPMVKPTMNVHIKTGVCHTLIILVLSTGAGTARADQIMCAQSQISVSADKKGDQESACDAVQSGLLFLKSIGLDIPGHLKITLLNNISEKGSDSVIGYYDLHSNEIYLLDLETVMAVSRRALLSFGLQTNPAIWRSYIIHELAHAAAQHSFVTGVPGRTASEYIASAAQIASLPTAERQKIISNYPELSGFEKTEEIVFAYYLLDPGKFSIKAYLHFSRPENGRKFIHHLLQEGLSDD